MHRKSEIVSILLNIMFYAPMERFQLELIILPIYLLVNRPVENVVLTTKSLQERNTQVLDGTMVKIK